MRKRLPPPAVGQGVLFARAQRNGMGDQEQSRPNQPNQSGLSDSSEGPFPPRGSVCQLWPREVASYKHENKALFIAIYIFRGAVMLRRIEA